MKRKIVALFLATCMAASMTACGGQDASTDNAGSNNDTADDAAGDDAKRRR